MVRIRNWRNKVTHIWPTFCRKTYDIAWYLLVLPSTSLIFIDVLNWYSLVFSDTQIFIPYKEEVTGSNPVAPTRVFQKYLQIIYYYEIMKYKKDLGGFLVLLGLAWQVFSFIRSDYTPTQVILVAIFAYLGMRLTYFVYFKDN